MQIVKNLTSHDAALKQAPPRSVNLGRVTTEKFYHRRPQFVKRKIAQSLGHFFVPICTLFHLTNRKIYSIIQLEKRKENKKMTIEIKRYTYEETQELYRKYNQLQKESYERWLAEENKKENEKK